MEPDEFDLTRFQRWQDEGRLDEALSLWGGRRSPNSPTSFAQPMIARLEELRLGELARFADLSRAELWAILEEAMAEKIVTEAPGAFGRLRFTHVLIRDAAHDSLTAAGRVRLHRQAGEALYAPDADSHVAELAHHYFAGAPAGSTDKAVEYAGRAGDRAARLLAYEEAVRLYEMALTLTEDGVLRCELLLAVGDAQARSGDTASSRRTFREVVELAGELGLSEQLARGALGYGGRIVWDISKDDESLAPLLERGLSALGEEDSPLRVRLLARLAAGPLRDASFPPEGKQRISREALEMARRLGDPATLAYALAGYIPANHSPEFTREQVELAGELAEVAMGVGDLERALEGHEHRRVALLELGEPARAKADLAAIAKLAAELGQPAQNWTLAENRAQHALLEGRLDEAERWISEAIDVGGPAQGWSASFSHRVELFTLRRLQGRLEDVAELIRRSADEFSTKPICRCLLAHMASELAYESEARKTFELLAAGDFAGLPFGQEWLGSMSLLAETAAYFRDVARAAILYERFLPWADRVVVTYSEISTGSVSRYLGLLATTMGRLDDAARHFEYTVAMNERMGARPWLAYTQEDYARMALERGDRARARELLGQTLGTYRELGMETAADRAATLAQKVGTTAPSPPLATA